MVWNARSYNQAEKSIRLRDVITDDTKECIGRTIKSCCRSVHILSSVGATLGSRLDEFIHYGRE